MKKVFFIVLLFNIFCFHVRATDLNGTTGVIYVSYNRPFNGALTHRITGFVRMESGFTCTTYSSGSGSTRNSAGIIWDACVPLSGAVELQNTNSITLIRDLVWESNLTLSSGGNIYGNGNAINLYGNLTIPAGTTLHIGSDTIIDGKGNDLIIGPSAQIFVDMNKTLTLENLVLKNGNHAFTFPPIRLATHRSKLALSNVEIVATGDFLFPEGQLFVYNDVAFTGSSAFVYWSTQQSFIEPNSCLYFDSGTTFSVAPATLNSERFDVRTTQTLNNFINLLKASSSLYFNNCSFKTTTTGCRFRTGTVFFDNKVSIDSKADSMISTTPITTIGSVNVVDYPEFPMSWSPDGKFILTSMSDDASIRIYKISDAGQPSLVQSFVPFGAGNYQLMVSWSPDGRFFAALNTQPGGLYSLDVYRFSETLGSVRIGSISPSVTPRFLSWSPDGQFIVVFTVFITENLEVYRFSESGNLSLAGSTTFPGASYSSMSWSSDGKFIAFASDTNLLDIYSFSAAASLVLVGSVSTTITPNNVKWSPDSRFIAVSSYSYIVNPEIEVFEFTGGNPVLIGSVSTSAILTSWSQDGRYIIGLRQLGSPDLVTLQVFQFIGSGNPIRIASKDLVEPFLEVSTMSPDGRFVAVTTDTYVTGTVTVPGKLTVHKLNYMNDTSTQAESNSIIFGNSSFGSGYDVNLNFMGGANVDVKGRVFVDNVEN